jgi:glycosyltransferase involved in cell wall biosynthesis
MPHRLLRKLRLSASFGRFTLSKGRDWYIRKGRLPRLSELSLLARKAFHSFRHSAAASRIDPRLAPGFNLPSQLEPYQAWLRFNHWNIHREQALDQRLAALLELPLISIVMPVFNPPTVYFQRAVETVLAQRYKNWELCLCDDASTDPGVRLMLESLAANDSRIRVVFHEKNGNISRATNSAAAIARGEFLAFLDQDDELTPDALGELVLHVIEHPGTDIVYSDDDKIDAQGKRFSPQFKPDWSPELLLSYMYFSHLWMVRRSLFEAVGGTRVGFEGSQDYDLALRVTERARRIGHVSSVLYHWRVLPGSTAQSGKAKPLSLEAGRRAVADALVRRGIAGEAVQPTWAAEGGLGIFAIQPLDDGPRVTLVIPTRNSLGVLKTCIDSLARTSYRNYEVLIADNDSDDPKTLAFLEGCGHRIIRISNPPGGFNFAWVNNRAVETVDSELVLFLNNDTEIRDPNWLSSMVSYARIEGVGAVGARLLFPDGRVQHAGVIHGMYDGMAGPANKLLPNWHNGYLSYAAVSRNYLAVTAACLLVPTALFRSLGGFDERNFGVAFNDVDLCYRIAERGLRSVYCAGAELIHHEGYSRGFDDNPAEETAFRRRYGSMVDPYYNPNLSLENERFEILPRAADLRPPAAPIRALMVAFNLNLEGAPYSQYELTVGLKRLGRVDPVVYCPEDGPLRQLYESQGIGVVIAPHPLRDVYTEPAYDEAIERFAALISDLNVSVVYANTLQTFFAIEAARYLRLPSIWNPRESEPWQSYFAHFGEAISIRALKCFSYPYRVIFVAHATRSACEPLNSQGNFITIHNGIDPLRAATERAQHTRESARQSLGLIPDDIAILVLGTVCERKGQIDLVEALAKLPAGPACQRLHAFIVGDRLGAYSQALHEAIARLEPSRRDRVSVVKETRDTPLYFSAADAFACTSRLESYPRVILEAMSFGLPIITTPVFGISEQVVDGVSALLYSPGDVDKLATHLQKLGEDEALRSRLGRNASLRLDRLTSFDEMIGGYADAFTGAYFSASSQEH